MKEYWIEPQAGTGCDRAAIQKAIEEASDGCGNVRIPQGTWTLDGSLLIPERIHIHLEGAHLRRTAPDTRDAWILHNSRAYDGFGNNRVGGQRGIVITGEKDATLEGPCGILLRNASRFVITGLRFLGCTQYAISLAFSFQGKLRDLRFRDCLGAVECCAGTRDCIFQALSGDTKEPFLLFDDTRRREMGVYYYGTSWSEADYTDETPLSQGFAVSNTLLRADGRGFPVTNHILRDISGDCQINGSLSRNILSV